MREEGTRPSGVEVGNAWKLRPPGSPTNWIIGQAASIPADSLRFMEQGNGEAGGRPATGLALKWFVHEPADPSAWGKSKPTSAGRTCSILAGSGAFELVFIEGGSHYRVTLDEPGDFAIWGPGLEHSWRPLATSTILTCRWTPL